MTDYRLQEKRHPNGIQELEKKGQITDFCELKGSPGAERKTDYRL